ncbi:hypothetical protein BD779DRAFT_535958 [Infundibulicybe gibba]|nr:hypothetical protein BD779DRAFT_535958 [Infundibulicybe gibba]
MPQPIQDVAQLQPPSFAWAWGGLTVCMVLVAVLKGCIAMQAYTYFSRFKNDLLGMRFMVAIIWLGTTLHLVSEWWSMHNILITGYPQSTLDVTIPIAFSLTIVLQAFVHCCSEGVYIYRMHLLGRRMWVLVPCCTMAAVKLVLGLVLAVRMGHSASAAQVYARSLQASWMITSFFTIGAVLDVTITLSVCVQLWQGRGNGMKRTKYMVDKIIQWTVQTAMLTSVVAIAVVLEWNLQRSELWAGLSGIQSDCYVCCLLALLNARTRLRGPQWDASSLPLPSTKASIWGRNGGIPDPAVSAESVPPRGV